MIQWRKIISLDFHHIPKLYIGLKNKAYKYKKENNIYYIMLLFKCKHWKVSIYHIKSQSGSSQYRILPFFKYFFDPMNMKSTIFHTGNGTKNKNNNNNKTQQQHQTAWPYFPGTYSAKTIFNPLKTIWFCYNIHFP